VTASSNYNDIPDFFHHDSYESAARSFVPADCV